MGIENRDWYREAYKEKEKKYGADFSSKPSFQIVTEKPHRSSGIKTVLIYVIIIAVALGIVLALNSPELKNLMNGLTRK